MSKRYHVVQHDAGWAVRREGAERVSSKYTTQAAAIAAGRRYAKVESTELIIHGRNGRIRNPNSYGNDPNPPRDRRH